MQIHTTMQTLDEIKDRIRAMHGHEVAWEKNQDGRKQQQTCHGVIEKTYRDHFSVKTPYGYTSFNYVDLLIGSVVLHDRKTGVDILELQLKK